MTGTARGFVQTVAGPIAPEALGPTLMHEHLLCDITPPDLVVQGEAEVPITLENCWEIRHHWCRHRGNNRLTDIAVAVDELARLKRAGGGALVEVTTQGIKPDPLGLRRISELSGVTVVAGCGYYVEEYLPDDFTQRSVEALAETMLTGLTRGLMGSDVKAGIIGEIGCSDPLTGLERRVLQAAALAQRETGSSITIHPGRRPEAPAQAVEVVRESGGDPARCILGHIDRTIFDDDTLFRLADTGCVIEYDFFGIESAYYPFQDIDLPNDGGRLAAMGRLIVRGHLAQIVISQDICTKTRLSRFGGHGYGYIFEHVVPMMRRRGFGEAEIETIVVATPRRLLTLQ